MLSIDILSDHATLHGAWPVKGNHCNEICEFSGSKPLQEVPHPTTFQLKHPYGVSLAEEIVCLGVIKGNARYINTFTTGLFYEGEGGFNDSEGL